MSSKKLRDTGRMITLVVLLACTVILSNCRSCRSANVNTNTNINRDTRPTPSTDQNSNSTVQETPTPTPSPQVANKIESLAAWASKIDIDAWINSRREIPIRPGEGRLYTNDRVSTDEHGQASVRFSCGTTLFLFHDSQVVASPCLRGSSRSGSCVNGGAVSMDQSIRSCWRRVVLGTGSAEINLMEVNSAHVSRVIESPTAPWRSADYQNPKSALISADNTNVIVHYFPTQKATVVQVRSIQSGVVLVKPVLKEGDRRHPRVLDTTNPIRLNENQCAVSQLGQSAGPPIRGVPQRQAVPCDKNLWPLLLELAERENRKPITVENASLITDIALRRGQPVPDSERGPVPRPTPSGLNFEQQEVGKQKVLPLIIENRGKPPLSLGQFEFDGSNKSDFAVVGNNCAQPFEDKCEFRIGFTPTAVGRREANFRIPHNGANLPLMIPVAGTGTTVSQPPSFEIKIDVSARETTFPIQKVGTSTTRIIPIRNTGQTTVRIDDVSIQGDKGFVSKNGCNAPIAPNQTCNVEVTFAPNTAAGFSANLLITAVEANPVGTPPRTLKAPPVELKGTSGVPVISSDDKDLCFEKHKVVEQSDPKVRQELSLNVSNSGSVPLTISKVAVTNDDFKVVGESCTAADVAAAVGKCRISIGFTPRKSKLREGILLITHDDVAANPLRIPLKGVGKPRNIFARVFQAIFARTKNPCH
jgi:Cep192 domain 4